MLLLFLQIIEEEQDRRLLELLYIEYRDSMYGVACSVLRNSADAEDAVQTVFMNVASKHIETIKGLESDSRKRSYLLAAGKYTAIDSLRRKSKAPVSMDQLKESGFDPADDDGDFTEEICAKYSKSALAEALSHLGELYRIVLYYRFGEDMSVSEIASLLGRKAATVNQQLVRGKKLLLAELASKGGVGNDD